MFLSNCTRQFINESDELEIGVTSYEVHKRERAEEIHYNFLTTMNLFQIKLNWIAYVNDEYGRNASIK